MARGLQVNASEKASVAVTVPGGGGARLCGYCWKTHRTRGLVADAVVRSVVQQHVADSAVVPCARLHTHKAHWRLHQRAGSDGAAQLAGINGRLRMWPGPWAVACSGGAAQEQSGQAGE
eukprot:144276-Chlamydomonas_euryale.AAC.1